MHGTFSSALRTPSAPGAPPPSGTPPEMTHLCHFRDRADQHFNASGPRSLLRDALWPLSSAMTRL